MLKRNHLFTKGKQLLLCLLLSASAQAADDWSFSGFASLGAGRVEDDGVLFMDYASDEWSFESDSVVGLHARGNLAERLSLTMQVVARGYNWDDTDDFEPELDWLFLSYQLAPEWRLRVGRMRTPHYLYSETVDVGYSYVWVRPPVDVYAPILAPFSNFDGADITWLTDWNDASIDMQLLAGHMQRSRDTLEIEVEPVVGGNISLQKDEITLRYSLTFDRSDIELGSYQPAEDAYRSFGPVDPVFDELADALSAENAWYRYQALGGRWEHGDFALIGEVFDIQNLDEGYDNPATGWYLSLQYKLGRFTPYAVAGQFENNFNSDTVDEILGSFNALSVGTIPEMDRLRARNLALVRELSYEQETWTLGLRVELLSNLSLKGEWQRFKFEDQTTGQLLQTSHDVPGSTSVTTFTLDLVF